MASITVSELPKYLVPLGKRALRRAAVSLNLDDTDVDPDAALDTHITRREVADVRALRRGGFNVL